ncbi:sigma-70 family RNA polymerase sigma factor [bacterium D16-51]|nr:sigma-70 family RNA polymerase sigma factor [bacterium D16-59]RKI59108.1 sigma-70 family RNA polymerase sigma factor [bacterium D16-51]
MEEQQVIELFWQRDKQAIRETEHLYAPLLQKIAKNITFSVEDAEECVNDTYFRLWNSIPPERPMSLRNYAARITRNLAIDMYRKNHSKGRGCEMAYIAEEIDSMFGKADSRYDSLELKEIINTFLGKLDEKNRILFVRRYWMAESICELAGQFHMKESAVKMRLSRTREKFRKYLECEM